MNKKQSYKRISFERNANGTFSVRVDNKIIGDGLTFKEVVRLIEKVEVGELNGNTS